MTEKGGKGRVERFDGREEVGGRIESRVSPWRAQRRHDDDAIEVVLLPFLDMCEADVGVVGRSKQQ